MKIVNKSASFEEIIKKSRFIGIINPCQSENQAHNLLQQQQQRHPNASHIVFAYRINTDKGLVCRFHDAGEPAGTAGKPIFQHLEGKQLINVIVIVIRYFGGIKLGAGGLTRAYGNTAGKVIDEAQPSDYIEYAELEWELEYKQISPLEYHLKRLNGEIIHQEFSEKVRLSIKIPKANLAELKALL